MLCVRFLDSPTAILFFFFPDPDFGGMTTHTALVKRALTYAINRPRIVNELYGGYADVATTGLPVGFPGHNATFEPYPYDPDKAITILQDLGYDAGYDKEKSGWNPFVSFVSTLGALMCLFLLQKRWRKRL